MSVHRVKAASQQTPPADAVQAPILRTNITEIAAIRLANAYTRSSNARSTQVDGYTPTAVFSAKTVKPIFWDLARKTINRNIANFEGFITAQFAYSVPKNKCDETIGQAPSLITFASETGYERWLTYNRRIIGNLQQELETSSLAFECECGESRIPFPAYTPQQRWNFVLMNNFSTLSPLFRYAIAISEGLAVVADNYRDAALQQLLMDPISYVCAWGDVIPQGLRQSAEEIIMMRL